MSSILVGTMLGILAGWGVLALWTVGVDSVERRRHDLLVQARDWDRKVQAMRRIYDEEGNA
jgi:uncharacterized membrane protein